LSLLSSIEQLDIFDDPRFPVLQVDNLDMDHTQWLELFQPFTTIRALRISHKLRSPIVSAFRRLTGEMATAVLPALNSLYLEGDESSGSEQQAMEPFITARQRSGYPVDIHHLERMTVKP
jgi:hypothetical protein